MRASIPVDVLNPGQVFACLGFMEAAEVLLGDVECGFDWCDRSKPLFHMSANGDRNPFEVVLEFLANADIRAIAPKGIKVDIKKEAGDDDEDDGDEEKLDGPDEDEDAVQSASGIIESEVVASLENKLSGLAIRIMGASQSLSVSHWTDGSTRETFKLYAGNRSGLSIAKAMQAGKSKTSKGGKVTYDTCGLRQLWQSDPPGLTQDPFNGNAVAGNFGFDARATWTSIDAGYSPDTHANRVLGSSVVELLCAIGLENARPDEFETRRVRFSIWCLSLPPLLARAAIVGALPSIEQRTFKFELALAGKVKKITHAKEELQNE